MFNSNSIDIIGIDMDRERPYHRIVCKLGTNVLTGGTDRLDLEVMANLVGQMARLYSLGLEIIVVTSGAIAAGWERLGFTKERKDIPFRQVMASVGQSRLMQAYEELFSGHGITVAQALLTRAELSDRAGYLNARNTLLALLELGVVPIVNENDVVAIEEIMGVKSFGDNDSLSAMVANLVDADLLVLLTDTEGLYTADPNRDKSAQLIPRVEKIDGEIERLARGTSGRGIGGMETKIQAAKLATASGVAVVIASGKEPHVIERLSSGEAIGTLFPPTASKMESRKRFLLAGLSIKGRLTVDEGAVVALKEQNKSLLPAGVRDVEGEFGRGDSVEIVDGKGQEIACGISNYSSSDIAAIKGVRSDKIEGILGYEYGAEVVHRNNLVVI